MKKFLCVISHTHWDREWYLPFEKFRVKLVDLMDNLLDILAANPEYIFHLDAQTIVLEDYLEIRPNQKEKLQKYIKAGQILIGPWYVQNDFYLTSGEATIRNLLIGSQQAAEMGKCTWVGYTPDQFGLIGQLPQIFRGFGIESCIFGRGYNFYENIDGVLQKKQQPAEFIWKADDGSEVLAIHMPFWYNNAQRFSEDLEKTLKLLQKIQVDFAGIAITPFLLLMNGVDHLEAQENLLPILKKANHYLDGDWQVEQATMPDYIKKVNHYLSDHKVNLPTYQGELRNGEDHNILHGTLSSRVYLKIANAKAQILLENYLEPIYSFVKMVGGTEKYPADYLRYLWKQLLHNHPHDSICGCSVDPVHRHMEDRFERINELGEELLQRGMDFIASHITRAGISEQDYLITVFNTIAEKRNGVATVELLFPVTEAVKGFKLFDIHMNEVSFTLIQNGRKKIDINSPINLPGIIEVDWYQIQFYVSEIAELSYRTFIIQTVLAGQDCFRLESADEKAQTLENEYLEIKVGRDGEIDLRCKETGELFTDILDFEDEEDGGDSYIYRRTNNGKKFTVQDFTLRSITFSTNQLSTKCIIRYEMGLPAAFEFKTMTRDEALVTNGLEIELVLEKGSRWVGLNFKMDNRSKDHRLWVLIKTGVNSEQTMAATPFGVVKKGQGNISHCIKGDGVEPNTGFVDISKENGIAIFNIGLYDYEHLVDNSGTIAITLLRANGRITSNAESDRWFVPENQCLRELKSTVAFYPHQGDWQESDVARRAQEFQVPLLAYFSAVNVKKFSGGRPAVQDWEIQEIFFRQDPDNGIELPRELQFIKFHGDGIVLSALKKAEHEDAILIRVYNIRPIESKLELEYYQPIHEAFRVDLNEVKIGELSFKGTNLDPVLLHPGQIVSFILK